MHHSIAQKALLLVRTAAWWFIATGYVTTADAQLGTSWTQATYTKKIHLDDENGLQTFNWSSYQSVGSGSICADYSSSSGTETFRILDNRSNRAEIRLQNEYSAGRRQFEGYVTFYSPLNDESLFQIFGSTSGATLCMMRGYSSSGGSIRTVGGGGTLATGVYGVEKRINVVHSQNNYVQFYVDGVLKADFPEAEAVTNYWKYGCYGTLTTGAVTVRWRNVKTFVDGYPPKVELYQNTNYAGWKSSLTCGSYTLSELVAMGFTNDDASSIKVPSGYRVTLYTSDNFGGSSIVKTSNDSSLVDDGFNDVISSIKVEVN
jgi:Peptidase inhibitor family I36